MKNRFLNIALWFFTISSGVIPVSLWAQTNVIQGVVLDSTTQKPLPGANIMVEGTVLGAATTVDGDYEIARVPGGSQTLAISMIGYQEKRVTVQVSGNQRRNLTILLVPTSLSTPQLVVTGARRTVRTQESPVSIGTISGDKLRTRLPTTIEEILPYQPGIQVVGGQVNIRGSSGYTRGAGSRVLLLIDGLPVLAGDNGGIYWDAVPSHAIERIEILKGAGSALYGSNALGGVINIITSPIEARSKTIARMQGGYYTPPSHKSWQWRDTPLFTGQWSLEDERRSGRWGIQAAVGQQSSPGYLQNGWYRRWFIRGKMVFNQSSSSNWSSRLFMMNDYHGSFTQWRSAKQPFNSPEESVGDYLTNDKLQWSLSWSGITSADLSHTWRLIYYRTAFQNHFHDNKTYSTSNSVTTEWQSDYRWLNHLTTGGVELSGTQVDADIWQSHTGYNVAAYLQDEWHPLLRWRFTTGVRFDYSTIEESNQFFQVNPKLGVNLTITDHLSFRASLGRAFRAPSIAEQFTETHQSYFEIKPNPNLEPETSLSGETGLQFRNGSLNLYIALFTTRYQNLIEPQPDLSDGKIYFQNITTAQISGVETSGEWKLPWLPVKQSVSYTYLYPRDVSADTVLAYRHAHVIVVQNEVALSQSLGFGLDYQYRSRIARVQLFPYNPETGADKRVPVHLWSLTAFYHPVEPLTIRLSVENLFQYYYVMIERNMGAPRHIRLGLEYVW